MGTTDVIIMIIIFAHFILSPQVLILFNRIMPFSLYWSLLSAMDLCWIDDWYNCKFSLLSIRDNVLWKIFKCAHKVSWRFQIFKWGFFSDAFLSFCLNGKTHPRSFCFFGYWVLKFFGYWWHISSSIINSLVTLPWSCSSSSLHRSLISTLLLPFEAQPDERVLNWRECREAENKW